uniref:PARP catalytic domain-containing protein n=1 Tax=Leptobrachium leishanense TaxID=445787 RepID=A0A8C5N074_9ANUR
MGDFTTIKQAPECQPDDGKIYSMYHGTTAAAAEQIIMKGFRQSPDGMLGRGVYVSRDPNKAARYPLEDKRDQVILKLRVNVGKVKKIDRQYHPMQKTWHKHGFDTAWVPPNCDMVRSGLEEDCVWDPKRIRVDFLPF